MLGQPSGPYPPQGYAQQGYPPQQGYSGPPQGYGPGPAPQGYGPPQGYPPQGYQQQYHSHTTTVVQV